MRPLCYFCYLSDLAFDHPSTPFRSQHGSWGCENKEETTEEAQDKKKESHSHAQNKDQLYHSPTLTTATLHQGSMRMSGGAWGSSSLARPLLRRHIRRLDLQALRMAMYSLRPTPVSRNASAAWGGGGGGHVRGHVTYSVSVWCEVWCEGRREDWFCTHIGRRPLRAASAIASFLHLLVSTCVTPLLRISSLGERGAHGGHVTQGGWRKKHIPGSKCLPARPRYNRYFNKTRDSSLFHPLPTIGSVGVLVSCCVVKWPDALGPDLVGQQSCRHQLSP